MRPSVILAAALAGRLQQCDTCAGTGRALVAVLLPDGEVGARAAACRACGGRGRVEVVAWL